ncbi:MAG: hypothetical protein IKJ82_01495 [Oscillospiraceae bacterium]|nr:hypothetical protein [Oscillospiraceae bacterium]
MEFFYWCFRNLYYNIIDAVRISSLLYHRVSKIDQRTYYNISFDTI